MRHVFVHVLSAAAIGAFLALSGPPAFAKTTKECNAEYKDKKADLKAQKIKKADFMKTCEAEPDTGAATTPAAPAAAPAPAPAAAAPAAAPAPAAAKPAPVPTATEAELKAKCPTDTIVWVNTKSSIYHYAGTHDYGNTKAGAYMCEADAKAAGDRAAKNEKHP
jgi:hypothetical protein